MLNATVTVHRPNQGTKSKLCKAIKIQRYDKNTTAIPRKCTHHKQVKSELIVSTFCCTVAPIERDIDGKLCRIIERITAYIWFPFKQFYLDHGSRSKVLKSHSFDRRCQNVPPF